MLAAMVASSPSRPKRPPGWVPPGPSPARTEVPLHDGEELSLLTGDWCIVQRKDGHRWSLDDLVTAWLAAHIAKTRDLLRGPFLDIGTGIGSVALMMAWSFPEASVTGLEAQAISFAMSTRSAAYNGCADRVTFRFGDLRDPTALTGTWPLVTGTPPYFDDPLQTRSNAPQKEPCRFETRGGVEDYLLAMHRLVAHDGVGVVCHAARQRTRVLAAIEAAQMTPAFHLEVTPKLGRDPLVDVFAVVHRGQPDLEELPVPSRLTVRDAGDQWTPDFLAVREAMGLPPRVRPPREDKPTGAP
jgi:tRNA1(Val) A37 N6-methylase TrmN6